jgi:hypothetical protein
VAKKLYGFDDAGRREYRQIKKTVLGGGKQAHVFKKWERGTTSRSEFIITGLATAAVTSGDATFTIDGLENITAGTLPSTPLSVKNTLALTLADNQKVYAILDAASEWETWGGAGEQGPAGDSSLFADFTATADSLRTSDTITADIDQYWGGVPGSTTGVTVNKLSDHDITIFSGDKFRGVWDSEDNQWKLFWFDGLRLTVKGAIATTAVTEATTTFTLATPSLVNGWRLPGSITVTNDPPIYAEVGTEVTARFNLTVGSSPSTNWDTGDGGNFLHKLRGIGSWNDSTNMTQVVGQKAGVEKWYGMASLSVSQAAEDFNAGTTAFDTDNHAELSGDPPTSTQEVSNDFDLSASDGELVLIGKEFDSAEWVALAVRGSTLRWGRVTTAISAATGPLTAAWGSGAVKLQSDSAGTVAATATTVNNLWIETEFVVDSQVLVDMKFSPPRVVSGTCAAVAWS